MDNGIVYTKDYEEFKTELREELGKSVNSFVRIGYLLKVARDTNILMNSEYLNMEEFAYAEFKIDKGTASKFMAINDRFSEGGNSDHLKPEYAGIGWSKLSIMLQLPDTANEEISTEFSKSEIKDLREEFAEAEKETPMETLLEGETGTTAAVEDNLEKAVRQLGESEPEIYISIHAAIKLDNTYNLNEIKSIMAPSGENIYSIRIRGVGRIMLSLKDHKETISMINERTGEKKTRLWDDLARAWLQIIDVTKKPEENWEITYDRIFPQKEKVAPVQPLKKETKVKKVNDKHKNVTKTTQNDTQIAKSVSKPAESVSKPSESVQETLNNIDSELPAPSPIPSEPEEPATVESAETNEEPEEQIPGQDNIMNHPEYLPEEHENMINTSCGSNLDKPAAAVVTEYNELSEDEIDNLWVQINEALDAVIDFVTAKYKKQVALSEIKKAYSTTVSMAADLEKLLINAEWREKNGKVDNAQ